MKRRGIAVLVGLLVVVVAGGVWMWKRGGRDTPATATATQRNGSAVAAGERARGHDDAKAARVTVTVRGPSAAVADAVVRLQPERGDVIVARSGADGKAHVENVVPGTYAISASADGYEPAVVAESHAVAAGEHVELDVELKSGGRVLSGTVTDVSGGPVAGARIDAAKLGMMVRPGRAVASAVTGPDGKYRMTVAEGQLLVAARSVDYAAQSRIVEVGESGATADFALVPGGVIEGVVVNEKSGAPVAGATVFARLDRAAVMLAESGSGAFAVAGSDGRFRLSGLRPGAYELGARAGDGLRSKAPTIVGLGIAEQVGDVEILVGKSPVVRGTVIDDSGAPIPKVQIVAAGATSGGGEGTESDDKGAFVLDGLVSGKYMLFATSREHIANPTAPIELKDKDVENVVVRMRRAAKIVGRIEPPQVCDVESTAAESGGMGMRMMRFVAPVTSGADGMFEVTPVAESPYTLSARCASGDQGKVSVTVKAGTNEAVIAVKPGAAIAGKVVDGAGKPVAGVTVMASGQDGEERTMIVNGVITSGVQALTNASGAYELRGLAPGAYRVSALDRGRPMQMKSKPPKVTLAAGENKSGVDLAVELPDGVIEGVVTGPDGKPLADAWVSVHQDFGTMVENMARQAGEGGGKRTMMMRVESSEDGDGGGLGGASEFPPALTDAQGRFAIRNLPHTRYDVIAEARAGKLRGRVGGIEPDARVTIEALGVTSLSGTVKSASGPTPLFTIELDGPTRAQRTFTDGKFELGRVDPGSYTVKVSSADGNAEAKVVVNANTPATVDITLVANAIVVGTIVDAAGKPVAGVPVTVVPDEGEGRTRIEMRGPPPTSGPDGKFRVEHKAGKSVLVVMAPPSPVLKRGLALEAGKVLDVGQVQVAAASP